MALSVREFDLPDLSATEALGERLATTLRPPAMVFLSGDLGAGKTSLTRALLRALGHVGAVPSPTYTLLEAYELGSLRCIHCDFYRVADASEIEYLGLAELMGPDCLVLIEWPEHGAEDLFQPDLRIELTYRAAGRSARLTAGTADGAAWLQRIP